MEAKSNRTELEEFGEFGLIQHLTQNIQLRQPSTKKGVGDDAAVLDYEGLQTVVTTDMLVEKVHFDLMYAPLKHLGYKAIAVNLSDIYAMNATPSQVTVSLAISNRFSVEALEELYSGMLKACEIYGVDLVGGDTTTSPSGMVISVTAMGTANPEELVYRHTARSGDLLCVSGDLGAAYLGLQILEREKQIFRENSSVQPDLEGKDYLLERQLKPEARREVIAELKNAGIKPTAMIDISDGLASEAIHLARNSKLGVNIFEDKIPIDPLAVNQSEEFGMDPTVVALNGGEDYELLFTVAQSDFEQLKSLPHISIIGHMKGEDEGYHIIGNNGSQITLQAQGWDAFLKREQGY
ncbi:MAG: thiamine-phosphate kinase [Salibacteraceae bacterium]